jgi:putative membrane protein
MKITSKAACGMACSGLLVLCGALGVTVFAARAQTASQGGSVDGSFVADATSAGMTEVKLGQLAEEKGWNTAVKDFGKKMESDHSKAGDELKDVADRNNITLASDMNDANKSEFSKLSGLSGKEFDKAYATQMVQDHESAVALFKKESSQGSNKDLKSFATKTLPTLEGHLQMARQMEQTVENE